jgi:signal transduction histidine kinase
MIIRRLAVVALSGCALLLAVAWALGMSAADTRALALVAAGSASLAGAVGAAALVALRRHSMGVQVTVVALTALAAVGAGGFAAAEAMFISTHDLHSLAVVLVASGTVGVLAATVLGHRVARATLVLEAIARGMGDDFGAPANDTDPVPATEELAALSRELAETSARLDRARAQERALEASRRELVAWVSHDLRTPLAGIRAMAEALEDGIVSDGETVARYHAAVRAETDRLTELVDDLFELSRIQAGALRLQVARASLGDLVSDALAASAPVARAKGVHLQGRLEGVGPDLDLSTPEVSRALRNLLENAIRHTPTDGAVFVEVGVEAETAFVAVEDACGGIPDEELDRVFDTAFRGELARTPSDESAGGLGLAIVRGVAEAHDGEVDVCNVERGCRFVVRLPLASKAGVVQE